MNKDEMLQFIEKAFEENYELLRLEGGHPFSPCEEIGIGAS